ncbi:MAG: type II toxin-antitoxin system HicB family antitoxin [Acidobacteria bacterium]|nr:type II toxin-antitoxin system HicB family antitoxin [Acidobacteriota bacterium]
MFVFTGVVVEEAGGYTALCPELDVASEGTTIEQAKMMLLEAATLHMEGCFEDGLPYLRPVPRADDPREASPEGVAEVFRFTVDVDIRAHA